RGSTPASASYRRCGTARTPAALRGPPCRRGRRPWRGCDAGDRVRDRRSSQVPQLREHSELVHPGPVLEHAPALDAVALHAAHRQPPARRRDAEVQALVRPLPAVAHRDERALGDQLLDHEAQIRERGPHRRDPRAHTRGARRLVGGRVVLDERAADELIEQRELAAAEDVLEEPADQRLVVVAAHGRGSPASSSIWPASSLTSLAQTIAVMPDESMLGLNSTTSAPTRGARMPWMTSIACRVVSPPGSRCDTPGACAGSRP